MDQPQSYIDLHQSHMSAAGQPSAPQTTTSGGIGHYSQYGHPPLLQPGPGSAYSPSQGSYGQYPYPNGVSSPQSAAAAAAAANPHVPSQLLPLPAMTAASQPPPGAGAVQATQPYHPQPLDTTGQVAPQGMKPRVTATLWEDEGSLCFQVEAKGICVARREDNHMINGTKLLNVAGMTRGRRDGILKSEKLRHVVKIGPMHLKGVWIPFERALDFANREKITHLLYPLFVHNIGALLYQSPGHNRTNAVMAAAERRRLDQRAPQTPQHHHHSMQTNMGSHMPAPPHSSAGASAAGVAAVAPQSGAGRPMIERAQTFPTPPASAHSIIGVSGADGGYPWTSQNMAGGHGHPPLSVDIGLSNARSLPSTPATTPPGTGMQSTPQYPNGQAYDGNRPTTYSAPPASHNSHYGAPSANRYGQPLQTNPYVKHEMRPPATRGPGSVSEPDRGLEVKAPDALASHGAGADGLNHGAGDEDDEADHEHEAEYGHVNHAAAAAAHAYNAPRASYGYSTGSTVGSMSSDHAHLSPELTSSPKANASGRATPRATSSQWSSTGYSTPPRPQPPSSNLYNVVSHDPLGTSANGVTTAAEAYPSQLGLAGPMQPGYGSQQQHTMSNGSGAGSNKRMREIDDDPPGRGSPRPSSRGATAGEAGGEMDGLKRRKTLGGENSLPLGGGGGAGAGGLDMDPNRGLNRTRSAIVQRRR